MKTFEKLQKMSDENLDIRLAPLQNIISVEIKGVNGEITIGVDSIMARELMAFIADDSDEAPKKEFIGGFLLADKKQFDAIEPEIPGDELT